MKEKIAIIFPKHSEALFNKNSKETFGGANVQMYNIAKELYNQKNIKTYSFVNNYPKINFDDFKYFSLIKTFNEKDNFFKKVIKFHKTIDRIKPDVMIQHGLTKESCLLAKYCKLKGIKFIFMFASDLEVESKYQTNQKRCWFFKMLLNNSYKLITQNNYQKEKLMEKYSKNSNIIRNGFILNKPSNELKSSILWVARSDIGKKPRLFLDLASKFSKEKFVMICPKSTDEYLFNEIMDKAKDVPNLEFLEFIEYNKINNYFKKAKLFINTSDYEGFPQTFIQATMNSVPIISLNSNPNNFLNNYKCGFCAKGNFNLMENKIKQILNKNIIYKKMSKNAFKYAKENHDIKINVKKLLGEIYSLK